MSEDQTDKTPSLSPTKPKRSSLKGANMMDANEIMKYSRKKRNSVSFQLGANFQFNKLRTTFQEMKPQIVNPTKKKSFVEKRKQSIKNEFALAKELLKKQKSIDEIENETEVKENTSKNAQVGKEIKESDSEDVSDESEEDEKNDKKKEEKKKEEKKEESKNEESKIEEKKKEDENNNNNDENLEAPDSNRGEKEALNEKKQLNSNCKFC